MNAFICVNALSDYDPINYTYSSSRNVYINTKDIIAVEEVSFSKTAKYTAIRTSDKDYMVNEKPDEIMMYIEAEENGIMDKIKSILDTNFDNIYSVLDDIRETINS